MRKGRTLRALQKDYGGKIRIQRGTLIPDIRAEENREFNS